MGEAHGRTIDVRWIEKALATAEARGMREEVASLRAGLACDARKRISASQHCEVWERLAKRAGRSTFPIEVAENMSLGDYDLLGLIGKTSKTLLDALEKIERYLPIWTDAYTCRVIVARDETSVRLELDRPGSLGARCATESAVAELTKAIRDLTGAAIVPLDVCYRHAAPADVTAHTRFFGRSPRFSADHDGLTLAHTDAARALVLADEGLRAYLTQQLDELWVRHQADWITQLRARVRDALGAGIPLAPKIARAFGTSTRTLHRRLADDGLTFGEIVEGEQLRLARSLLLDPRINLSEIATRVGFSEPSAFSRAYRRWTGRSPSKDRGTA